MTVPTDAFDIASRFLDSGKARNDLELAILRHMEHHIAVEREACAKVAETKAQDYLSPEYAINQPFSSHAERFSCKQVAEAIRTRTQ